MPSSSFPQDLTLLIRVQAEQALRERNLLMRPIPFFKHFDVFQKLEEFWGEEIKHWLCHLTPMTIKRVVRSYSFVDELTQKVFRNFCQSLPSEGEASQRILWGAAVLLDEILDEAIVKPEQLIQLQAWASQQAFYPEHLPKEDSPTVVSNHNHTGYTHGLMGAIPPYHPIGTPCTWDDTSCIMIDMLWALLESFIVDCRRRSLSAAEYARFHTELLSLLDAELLTISLTLNCPPNDQVRRIIYEKSTRLCWVGLQACLIGSVIEKEKIQTYRLLCDAVGEIFWIMDDLVDIEEDLARGVWNRTLLCISDRFGVSQFNRAKHSTSQLADLISTGCLVEDAIHEVAKRLTFLEAHPMVQEPAKLRSTLLFWITAWLGIYTN